MERLDLRKLSSDRLRPFRRLADDEAAPAEGGVLVSLDRLARDADALLARGFPPGLVVPGDTPAALVAPWLGRVALVAIDFPKFSDGRGFSLANRLRDQFGYKGEIRAIGQLIADHAEFLLRAGVSSVELRDALAVVRFRKRLKLYSVWYQDARDARPTVLELRHGRTRRRLAS